MRYIHTKIYTKHSFLAENEPQYKATNAVICGTSLILFIIPFSKEKINILIYQNKPYFEIELCKITEFPSIILLIVPNNKSKIETHRR